MNATQWKSGIYAGKIRHRRFEPKARNFTHQVVYFFLDLEEIPKLFSIPLLFTYEKAGLFSYHRKNYLGGRKSGKQKPLSESVQEIVAQRLGFTPNGRICMLTQITYFGFCFNPVTFFYCFNENSHELEAIVSEITNTPWGEKHSYVLDCRTTGASQAKPYEFQFEKEFHVSPFMAMDFQYRWYFTSPVKAETFSKSLTIHMENHSRSITPGVPYFDSTLSLTRLEWNTQNLKKMLFAQPLMTAKTVLLIYLHAVILWIKRYPFFSHPSQSTVHSISEDKS
jgi:DUF1365 family protein